MNVADGAVLSHQDGAGTALAGVNVRDDLVRNLALQVDDEILATKLLPAVVNETRVLALEVHERETILRTLADPPEGLKELRGVLLTEHTRRRREGF